MSTIWKVTCQEDKFPGMWQRWYRNQCVAVGWNAKDGYKLNGETEGSRGWSTVRNALKEVQIGDFMVVALRGHRVGRLGQVTRKLISDEQWFPLVPIGPGFPNGEMGRRVEVRWDLTVGPDNQDLVVQLPLNARFSIGELRPTVSRIQSRSLEELKTEMNNPVNWVSLLGKFRYEKTLSDYIANYPNHLEDGLLPHPNSRIRERVFEDHTRLDVLLMDKQGKNVIVECKQNAPSINDIAQIRHYMGLLNEEAGEMPRGILVHGGAQKLSNEVMAIAQEYPTVEIVNYVLNVRFRSST